MNGGLRMTEQRKVILEVLEASADHPTADEIYGRVRRRMPRISLGTVYRNLEKMASAGMVSKIESPGRKMRFDADRGRHVHVRCVRCGRIEDLERMHGDDGPDSDLEVRTGFRLLEKRVEYLGICPECEGFGQDPGKGRGDGHE